MMAKTLTEDCHFLIEQEALVSGDFVFTPELRISKNSRFADSKWDWSDRSNLRLKILDKSKLMIDWSEITLGATPGLRREAIMPPNQLFKAQLPEEIVEDLKRAFYIIVSFPALVHAGRKRNKKPNTIVMDLRQCVNFLSHVRLESLLPDRFVRIKTLRDITLTALQHGIETYPYGFRGLKHVLMLLAEEIVQSNLKHARPRWNSHDIKALHWPPNKPTDIIRTLPDRLFAFLSNTSSTQIIGFHYLLGNQPRDSGTDLSSLESILSQWPRFRAMYESYVRRREITRAKGAAWVSDHTQRFFKEFGIFPQVLLEFLFDVQTAAFQIILLYTGMRYSEAASLRRGCLITRDGVTLIKSTLIKSIPTNMPIDQDEWVAIAIVQDAVRVLEELRRCNFNNFLFSNFRTLRDNDEENPISNGNLNGRVNLYLRKMDQQNLWGHWQLSVHQYRHGLVHQLARAEVGIPYITRQLKHYHSLLRERSNKFNPVSTIYGMQKQRLISNASGLNALKDANIETAKDLYGEGRRFAGGGAALHVKKTEAFFRGMGLEGKAREKYVEKLAQSGVTAIRTGVGWCVRNHVDPQKLKDAPPPCIGDLNCNPHSCTHSVVPESRKAEVIARYRNAAIQLASSNQSHLTSHWKAELNAYAAMLQQLGVDPKTLPSPAINPDTLAKVLAGS